MLIIFSFYLLQLITKLHSKEIELKKLSNEKNEYNPYVFNFTLYDYDNNDTIVKYPSIFDTTQLHILVKDENIPGVDEETIAIHIKNNTPFYYVKTYKFDNYDKYYGIIGLSNSSKPGKYYNKSHSYLTYLNITQNEENKKYINFIQNQNEALMIFGKIDSKFDNVNSRMCKCKEQYWSCEISSLRIGVNDIYTSNELGIFSISEEYIIAPKNGGNKTLYYYKNKIKELFNVDCTIAEDKNDKLIFLTCDKYFNYEDLPDLSFVMKNGITIMALSIDLFKILKDYKLVFKIKYRSTDNINEWYLGEPVVKNYNFLLNYTNEDDANLIIVPASLNGFILIIVACVGGFLFLFIFLTIIYCVSKNDKKNVKRRSYFSNWHFGKRNSDIFFAAKNSYIKEKVEENEEEDEKSESSESKSDDKSDNKSDNNKSDNKSGSKSDSKSDSGSDSGSDSKSDSKSSNENNENDKKKEEENMLFKDMNDTIENIENIPDNSLNDNLIINSNSYDMKDKLSINPNNINNNPVHVELSINNYDDEDFDEENELIGKNNIKNNK